MKAINKEKRNQYLIPLPNWVSRFITNMHLTPQGLLTKKGKNDRLIWDGSFTPNWNAICINMMLNQKTEPEIIYGQAFINHLQHLYNFRLSYPDDEIVLMDDDVKGAFRHCKYHPDIASAFAFIIETSFYTTGRNIRFNSQPCKLRSHRSRSNPPCRIPIYKNRSSIQIRSHH